MTPTLRRGLGAFFLAVMALSAAYSDNSWGLRDRYPPPASRAAPDPAQPPAGTPIRLRSLPWWEPVATLQGRGSGTSSPFRIADEAVQWRVVWSCPAGRLRMQAIRDGEPVGRRDLVPEQRCAGQATGFSVARGELALRVRTGGAWRATIEQQVDRPKVEPPLPQMSAPGAAVLAAGRFYDVDRTGRGTVRLHRLPDGRHALRLDGFFVSINADLEVWLSLAPAPRTTAEAARADHVSLMELEATAGSMNVLLPQGLDPARFRSVVIWCEITRNAYAAAALSG